MPSSHDLQDGTQLALYTCMVFTSVSSLLSFPPSYLSTLAVALSVLAAIATAPI